IGVFVADFRVQEIQQLTLLRQDPFLVDRPRLALIQHNARALQYPGLAALAGSVLAWLAWQTRCHRNTVPLGGARLRFHSPVGALIDLRREERAQGHVAERWSEWRLQSPS